MEIIILKKYNRIINNILIITKLGDIRRSSFPLNFRSGKYYINYE